jgi:peptidoglycan/xylan/chitin deacetylase (PgdA/CDA1 family)
MCRSCAFPALLHALPRRQLARLAIGAAWLAGGSARAGVLIEPELRLMDLPPKTHAVAVTLDACPGHFDMRIAAFLVQERIAATIFVTALWLAHNPDGLEFLLAHPDLFRLENHGARHLPPVLGSHPVYGLHPASTLDEIRRDVADGAAALTTLTGRRPLWYRGATGLYSPDALAAIRQMGFAIAGYSLNSDMGASLPAATVAARIERAVSGSVIIGHINQPLRSSGLGIVEGLRALRRQGSMFVHLDAALPAAVS